MPCSRFLKLAVVCGGFALLNVGCGTGEAPTPTASIDAPAASIDTASTVDSSLTAASNSGQPRESAAKSQANNFPEVILKTTHGDIRLRLNA